ncbi:hypothetical protein DCAR_0623553 [Daucus carota subsp. sativus]|uniref:Uncharacterized protein n=1 Tax=Daucus carota subsp. sativus TaxID=79200 RepID=A0AAF1B2W9_DAUCS|nr:PREDICTED: uncharacterized protein LOC108224488 [Daucus carota subsp. sativus]WOH04145.1 hypothetical protein DCAR_0623553 [Daucus carota subsp. sativus]
MSTTDSPLPYINPHLSSSSPIPVSDTDSYLIDSTASGSNSFQKDTFLSAEPLDFGFSRPDFRQAPLVGTVDYYQRHVFLCYKNPDVWPPRIEAAEFDRLPRLLSAALAARKPFMNRHTRLTICEGHDGTETSNGDVLIFPDMIRYRRLTHFDVDTFVEEVLVKDGEWLPGTPEPLRGSYIFVCAHGTRDRRCGVCGPSVVARFKEEIELRGLQGKVHVRPCSHIGGHKYAGNVIIFGSTISGEATGHWYGYVMPDDAPTLLEQHIEKGQVVDLLWRGQIGLSEEDQKKSQEVRLQLTGGNNVEKSKNETSQTIEISSSACRSQVKGTCCYQTNSISPSSCCQDLLLPEISYTAEPSAETTTTSEKRSKKQPSRNNNCQAAHSRKVCAMPTWIESWEREDTYATMAVIGAAVSIVVAYNCYKQLT